MQECELIRQELSEEEVTVEGEFVSQKTMLEEWKWSEMLGSGWHSLT